MMRYRVALLAVATLATGTVFGGEWRYEPIPILGSAQPLFAQRAGLVSDDGIRIPWHRGGVQEIRAALSIAEAPDGTRVTLYVPDAKSICVGPAERCTLTLQFDDAAPISTTACRLSRDLSLDLREPAKFVRTAQQSKRLRITLPVKTSVPPTAKEASLGVMSVTADRTAEFTFDVTGLKFDPKADEPACGAEALTG